MNGSGHSRPRLHGDAGAAVVELAICATVLGILLFGIITFGIVLGYKQNMTQAASEGARAGALAPAGEAFTRADAATQAAVDTFGSDTCAVDSDALRCNTVVQSCTGTSAYCVTVTVTYDYDSAPLAPPIPLLGAIIPNTLTASSTAEINIP